MMYRMVPVSAPGGSLGVLWVPVVIGGALGMWGASKAAEAVKTVIKPVPRPVPPPPPAAPASKEQMTDPRAWTPSIMLAESARQFEEWKKRAIPSNGNGNGEDDGFPWFWIGGALVVGLVLPRLLGGR